eukprot:gene16066-22204_t
MSSVITDAERRLADSGKNRVLLWKSTLKTAIYDEDFLEEEAADLVALVCETFHLYRDQDSQRAVVSFLREAIKSSSFLKHFAAAVLKLAATPKLPSYQAFTLLVWSSITLEQLDPTAMKKAVTKLVELQATMLGLISGSASCRWQVASRVVCKLLKAKKGLVPDYVELAKTSGNPALIRVLMDVGRQDAESATAAKGDLVQVYCDKFMGAKEKPSSEALAATGLLVKNMTSGDVTDKARQRL